MHDTPDEQGLTHEDKHPTTIDGAGTDGRFGPSDEWLAFICAQLGRPPTSDEMEMFKRFAVDEHPEIR